MKRFERSLQSSQIRRRLIRERGSWCNETKYIRAPMETRQSFQEESNDRFDSPISCTFYRVRSSLSTTPEFLIAASLSAHQPQLPSNIHQSRWPERVTSICDSRLDPRTRIIEDRDLRIFLRNLPLVSLLFLAVLRAPKLLFHVRRGKTVEEETEISRFPP